MTLQEIVQKFLLTKKDSKNIDKLNKTLANNFLITKCNLNSIESFKKIHENCVFHTLKQEIKLNRKGSKDLINDFIDLYKLIVNYHSEIEIYLNDLNQYKTYLKFSNFIKTSYSFILKKIKPIEYITDKLLYYIEYELDFIAKFINKKDIMFIKLIINNLNNIFNFNQNTKYINKFHYIEKKLNKFFDLKTNIIRQQIFIEINPLKFDFSIIKLNIKEFKNIVKAENDGIILSNFHIESLKINQNIFGFDGKLNFNLLSFSLEKYKFLLSMPLILNIKIIQTYLDKENKEKTNIKMICGISDPHNNKNTLKTFDNYSLNTVQGKSFSINFCDPLKFIFSNYKNNSIALATNYINIFSSLVSGIDFIEILYSGNLLNQTYEQITISTKERNFYDYFIEILDKYNVHLVYANGDGITKYYIIDNIASSKNDIPLLENINSIKKCKTSYLKKYYPSIVKNINKDQEKISKISDNKEHFFTRELILDLDDSIVLNNNLLHLKSKVEKYETKDYLFKLNIKEYPKYENDIVPSYNIEKFTDIIKENYFFNCENLSLAQCSFEFKILKQYSLYLKSNINFLYDEKNKDFEQISSYYDFDIEDTTHSQSLKLSFINNLKNPILPKYKKFIPLVVDGEINIGQGIPESNQSYYKLFNKSNKTENFYNKDYNASKKQIFNLDPKSENYLMYKVAVSNEILYEISPDPSIFANFDKSVFSSAIFYPLKNFDKVKVKAYLEHMEIIYVYSCENNPFRASDKLINKIESGGNLECELTMQQTSIDQEYYLKQTEKSSTEDIINEIKLTKGKSLSIKNTLL